jgi:cytidylate kinase
MKVPRIVAIDGAAGSGKSTLARALAKVLRLPYVNTGLMYRALAAAAVRSSIPANDSKRLGGITDSLRFTLSGTDPRELEVEGYDDEELTTVEVEQTVAAVARHADVRTRMVAKQREIGRDGAVMEGRDIGRVVFPDAPVKFYLTADPSARTARRTDERAADGPSVAAALRARDEQDAVTNPFEPADAATSIVDTNHLGVKEALAFALKVVGERAPWLLPDGDG